MVLEKSVRIQKNLPSSQSDRMGRLESVHKAKKTYISYRKMNVIIIFVGSIQENYK